MFAHSHYAKCIGGWRAVDRYIIYEHDRQVTDNNIIGGDKSALAINSTIYFVVVDDKYMGIVFLTNAGFFAL
jgi:hypothetical protein